MAGLADMLVGSVMDTSKDVPDFSGNIQKGAELAKTIEGMKRGREQLEQQKAENNLAKYSKSLELLKIAHESKDPAIADSIFKHALPNQVRALGTSDVFTEEFLQTAAKSPETREKALGYALEIERRISEGEKAADVVSEIAATIPDPAVRAVLDTDRIIKAQATKASEDQLNKRAKMAADATAQRAIDNDAREPIVKEKIDVDKKWSTYTTGGGRAAYEKVLDAIDETVKGIKTGELEFGTKAKKYIPGASTEKGLSIIDETAGAAVSRLRGAVNLKEKLGDPNPSTVQMQDTLNRIINPKFSNELVKKSLLDWRKEVVTAEEDRQALFRRHGKVQSGKESSNAWVATVKSHWDKVKSRPKADQDRYLTGVAEKLGKSVDEIKKQLGIK